MSVKTFIERLEASGLYGEPADGLLSALESRYPNLDRDTAEAAAEHVIRTHGAGAFPHYPRCEGAILAALSGRAKGAPSIKFRADSQVSGVDDYFDRCQAYGRGIVIDREKDAAAWETWRIYFERLGMRFAASEFRNPGRTQWTVPARYPDEFDRTAPAPLTDEEVARARRGNVIDFRARANLAANARDMAQAMYGDERSRRRAERQHREQEASEPPAPEPVTPSEALLAKVTGRAMAGIGKGA